MRERLKVEKKKTKRMQTRVDNLESVVANLKDENMISSSVEEVLGSSFSGCTKELLERVVNNDGKTKAYPEELKCFAMTLNFYSPKEGLNLVI